MRFCLRHKDVEFAKVLRLQDDAMVKNLTKCPLTGSTRERASLNIKSLKDKKLFCVT